MPHYLLIPFVFALGACVGSFLNVVVWRLPRGESLVTPPSHCPKCNSRLAWYDNVPVFGWLFLRGRCRYCHQPISSRYPIIEAFTGALFVVYYVAFFIFHRGLSCSPVGATASFFEDWPIYMLYMWLISALLAESLIDAELFIIEPSVVWITAALGLFYHALMDHNSTLGTLSDLPSAALALAAGAGLGWLISFILWFRKLLPVSFPHGEPILEAQRDEIEKEMRDAKSRGEEVPPLPPSYTPRQIRAEMRKEMLFLMPALALGGLAVLLTLPGKPLHDVWTSLYQYDWLRGLLGSLLGAMVGGFTVWLTRILGTLGFGKVGMGRGDADLMLAVGAILGPGPAVIAFFIAPFFGILFALYTLAFHKHREMPYGPYLSLASAAVMILYCPIAAYLAPGLRGLAELLFATSPR